MSCGVAGMRLRTGGGDPSAVVVRRGVWTRRGGVPVPVNERARRGVGVRVLRNVLGGAPPGPPGVLARDGEAGSEHLAAHESSRLANRWLLCLGVEGSLTSGDCGTVAKVDIPLNAWRPRVEGDSGGIENASPSSGASGFVGYVGWWPSDRTGEMGAGLSLRSSEGDGGLNVVMEMLARVRFPFEVPGRELRRRG